MFKNISLTGIILPSHVKIGSLRKLEDVLEFKQEIRDGFGTHGHGHVPINHIFDAF